MKKLFTLVAAVMLVSAVFAQPGHGRRDRGYDDNDVVYNDGWRKNDHRRNDYYSFSPRERDMAIARINREYEQREQTIRFKLFMSPHRRAGMIRQLQRERRNEIGAVYARFNSPKNVFGDRNNRRYH